MLPPSSSTARSRPPSSLAELVDRSVALTGTYRPSGEFGPYVYTSLGRVHFQSRGSGRSFQRRHAHLDGCLVSASGVLRFHHSERKSAASPSSKAASETPPDYYYFEAETVKVEAASPVKSPPPKPTGGKTGG